MKIFFDEEFTNLHKNTTLISIGMKAEDGQTFYAEFTDYDKSQIVGNKWIKENVLDNLSQNMFHLNTFADVVIKDDKKEVKDLLLSWLNQFDTVEWVSDVCHYDFVLLIDLLFGNALDMPSKFTPVCHDINYDIALFMGISETEAFNKSREDILEYLNIKEIEGYKHNAIYDAKVIWAIYTEIDRIYTVTRLAIKK